MTPRLLIAAWTGARHAPSSRHGRCSCRSRMECGRALCAHRPMGIWCANWEMGCEALGIHGHFAVLSPGEKGVPDEEACPQLPRYDVSWVPDENI